MELGNVVQSSQAVRGTTNGLGNGNLARLVAFYLPQFHPIPENDRWWGKGFTEWTNVAKAKPLFEQHYQPRVPSDLGFYDLRVAETRLAQAEMAECYGIEGFCYWHYWFGGRRLLERPFNEVLSTGEPDFPFCLGWANESWTGIWHGAPHRMLIEQTYPGPDDYENHFYMILDALTDQRYITVEGRPIIAVYRPFGPPDPRQFVDLWRELAHRVGLKGLFLVGIGEPEDDLASVGYDGKVLDCLWRAYQRTPNWFHRNRPANGYLTRLRAFVDRRGQPSSEKLAVYRYADVMDRANFGPRDAPLEIPCVYPGWDNTPRSGRHGVVLHEVTPETYGSHLRTVLSTVIHRTPEKRLIFVKSWNEWAEGNYLEPDLRYGRAFLETTRRRVVAPGLE